MHKTITRTIAAALGALLMWAGLGAGLAGAHSVSGYYKGQRYPDAYKQVQWGFESGFPGSPTGSSHYKDAVLRAATAWNNQGQTLQFDDLGYRERDFSPRFSGSPRQRSGHGQQLLQPSAQQPAAQPHLLGADE